MCTSTAKLCVSRESGIHGRRAPLQPWRGEEVRPERDCLRRARCYETKQTDKDRWAGLAFDASNDQQDIARGKGLTGNDFSTLYVPLVRDGRMDKFYRRPRAPTASASAPASSAPTCLRRDDVVRLVDAFPGQSIDFFGALRARIYDEEVRRWVADVGVENVGRKLVNSGEGLPVFELPKVTLNKRMEYCKMLVNEQENVKRVQLADN